MRSLLFLLVCIFFINTLNGQCLYGLEHNPDPVNDSEIIIHKYGFPQGVEHHLYAELPGGAVFLDTILDNNHSDTLIFSINTDPLYNFRILGITPGHDTIGRLYDPMSNGLATFFTLKRYIEPSTINSSDGVIVFNKLNNGSSTTTTLSFYGNAGTVQEYPDSTVITDLSQGLFACEYIEEPPDFFYLNSFGLLGDPFVWSDVYADSINCPVGINLATNTSVCDGEAYVTSVQNGVAPYTYDWGNTGIFSNDTIDSLLCAGNHMLVIKDQNGQTRNCAFSIGSLDNTYFPPPQTNDTVIHSFTEYCMDSLVDSVSIIGSQIIDSVSASVVWSFFDGGTLVDQLLDTVYFSVPNSTYNNVMIHLHLTCNGDTLKSSSSVFTVVGYLPYPFTEFGYLGHSEKQKSNTLIYPNPTNSIIYFDSESTIRTVNLHTVHGALAKKITLQGNEKSIDVSGLKSGVYVIRLIQESGKSETFRILKE